MNRWLAGARPRTLPAAIVPVLVGTGVAIHAGAFSGGRAALCLVVALAMQIGVNYANDYSDGIRGTDDRRVGPRRLVGSGLATPGAVKTASMLSFGVGIVAGTIISLLVNPWLVLVGAACVGAGWFYTGGRHPYGYVGLGEAAVFVYFGLVATVGTSYVQIEGISLVAVAAACAVGSLAVALLAVNNLRDIPGDTVAGKRTLAVRLGDSEARLFYVTAVVLPFIIALGMAWLRPFLALVLLAVPLAVIACRPVLRGASGRDLIAVLGATGRLQLVFGILLAVGLAL